MPASLKQIEANRRNALKSTGPKTEAGKRRARGNATTHGLTASTTIHRPIRHENPADFTELRGKLLTDWNPVGTKEELCVEMIAAAYKRIQRAEAFETAYFDGAMEAIQFTNGKPTEPTSHDDLGCGLVMGQRSNRLTWENLDRYRRAAWLDYNRAVEQLRRLQKDRLDAELRELRVEKLRHEYHRRTHVGYRNAVPANGAASPNNSQMASFCKETSGRGLQAVNRPAQTAKPGPALVEACPQPPLPGPDHHESWL